MRPLFHPPLEEITTEGILYALSDPVRVRIFMQLAQAECSKNCSTFLNVSDTPLPKSTLSQHFKILREAGLIRSERRGVELQSQTRCAELKDTFGPMVTAIIHAYERQGCKTKRRASRR
ncbi:MAG: ArsR/SmtB family transcription factor [Gemmataceae bacterium]